MLNFSKRLLNEFTDWLLFNCRTQLIIRDRVSMRSLVVGGRGDKYDFSYKTSPVFNLTTFGIQ